MVAKALAERDTKAMLDVVADLEANGRSLQHFARELARYFRNLLVVRIEGKPTRLVAASPPEQERMLEAARQFTEDDLTRDLKLALDLFRDLQSSLQPRLHLEMGLLRLIHAGRLQPIEEALAALGGSNVTGSGKPPASPPKAAPPKPAPAASAAPSSSADGDFRTRLTAALQEAKLTHVADAVEHSEVGESPAEITFTAPKMYQLFLKGPEFEAAVRRVAGRTVKITLKVGEAASGAKKAAEPPKKDEAAGACAGASGSEALSGTVPGKPGARGAQLEGERNMKMPGNMQAMMQQAQKMQQKMQEEVALIRVEASAGGGMVTVGMDGQKNVTSVKIDPEVAGDVEMLQDLVMAACNEAHKKVEDETQKKMSGMLGGLGPAPGTLLTRVKNQNA